MKIAIIEDDMDQARLIAYWLKPYGFESTLFINAEIFFESPVKPIEYDLILVDWMLPGIDGLGLVKKISQDPTHPPTIFVTNKNKADELATALHSGADDFISKPINKTVLLARITAMLRRFGHTIDSQQDSLQINTIQQLLIYHEQTCHLTKDEVSIMSLFLDSVDTVITREQLNKLVRLNDQTSINSRKVDLKISRLRKKIKQFYPPPGEIINRYGQGYIFKTK